MGQYKQDVQKENENIYFWDQSHFTIVWNTRETGDIYLNYGIQMAQINLVTNSFQVMIREPD